MTAYIPPLRDIKFTLEELVGLVYGVTKREVEEAEWYRRPAVIAIVAGVMCIALNFLFF